MQQSLLYKSIYNKMIIATEPSISILYTEFSRSSNISILQEPSLDF